MEKWRIFQSEIWHKQQQQQHELSLLLLLFRVRVNCVGGRPPLTSFYVVICKQKDWWTERVAPGRRYRNQGSHHHHLIMMDVDAVIVYTTSWQLVIDTKSSIVCVTVSHLSPVMRQTNWIVKSCWHLAVKFDGHTPMVESMNECKEVEEQVDYCCANNTLLYSCIGARRKELGARVD